MNAEILQSAKCLQNITFYLINAKTDVKIVLRLKNRHTANLLIK